MDEGCRLALLGMARQLHHENCSRESAEARPIFWTWAYWRELTGPFDSRVSSLVSSFFYVFFCHLIMFQYESFVMDRCTSILECRRCSKQQL